MTEHNTCCRCGQTITGDYQVQLIENGSTNAFGNFMRYGSEPEFSIDLTRESGWIDATVYYGATGVEKNFRFLPVDPNTCAYRNPYYIGGESANEPCANVMILAPVIRFTIMR